MCRITLLLLVSTLVFGCSKQPIEETSLPYYNTPDFEPHFIADATQLKRDITHKIGRFSLTNQLGKTITDEAIAGKIHVANFVFTGCGSICPVMTNHMKLINDAYGNDEDVVMLSYSVTPWNDDVYTLKSYTDHNHITTHNWHFLTGRQSEIYSLARQSYFAEEDLGFTKDSTEFLHTEHFILVDQQKRIRGIYNGTLKFDIMQLVNDIGVLKSKLK